MHEPEINTSLFGRKSGDFESGIYTWLKREFYVAQWMFSDKLICVNPNCNKFGSMNYESVKISDPRA